MNRVVHFEIPAQNIERAKKFYKKIFNWNIISIPDMNYNILYTGPTDKEGMHTDNNPPFINGGMLERKDFIKSPVITIVTEDINKSLEQIKLSGGKILKEPVKVGEIGITAYFQDTEDNILSLWQPLKM